MRQPIEVFLPADTLLKRCERHRQAVTKRQHFPIEHRTVWQMTGGGDNLWNIARAHYGHGTHHTVIYGANKEQIRDPDLIYPGQVLSMPKVN